MKKVEAWETTDGVLFRTEAMAREREDQTRVRKALTEFCSRVFDEDDLINADSPRALIADTLTDNRDELRSILIGPTSCSHSPQSWRSNGNGVICCIECGAVIK